MSSILKDDKVFKKSFIFLYLSIAKAKLSSGGVISLIMTDYFIMAGVIFAITKTIFPFIMNVKVSLFFVAPGFIIILRLFFTNSLKLTDIKIINIFLSKFFLLIMLLPI